MRKTINSFDGIKISYDIERHGKYFLVFLHGAGGNLTAWRKERDFFHKKGLSTIAIDLRGHGRSGRPVSAQGYELEKFAKDVDVVLGKERVRHFIIVGHCFGGMVTIMFHKLFPQNAKAYILVDTTYAASGLIKSLTHHPFLMHIANRLLKHMPTNKASDVDFSKIVGTSDINLGRIYSDILSTSLKSWLFTYEAVSKFRGIHILKSIRKPVLIIHGGKDTIFDIYEAKKINRLVKGSRLEVVPNANHVIVLNNPRTLSRDIYEFVISLNMN